MCKWFKNLINPNKLVPKDIGEGLMSSMYYSIKIGEKLVVPDDCVCFLSFKDKIYCQFETGSYTLDEKTLSELISKQTKVKGKKIKKVKFDLFYVNLKSFEYNTKQTETILVDKKLCRAEILTNFCCKIFDAEKFQASALMFYALIRPIDAQRFVEGFVMENTNKFLLKCKFVQPIDSSFEQRSLLEFLNKKAEKIGINILDFSLSILTKSKQKVIKDEPKSIFDSTVTQTKELVKTQKSNRADLNPIDNDTIQSYNSLEKTEDGSGHTQLCPICKSKRIANSVFCHKCGYKF